MASNASASASAHPNPNPNPSSSSTGPASGPGTGAYRGLAANAETDPDPDLEAGARRERGDGSPTRDEDQGGEGPGPGVPPARVRMNLLRDAMASDRRGASLRATLVVSAVVVPQVLVGAIMLAAFWGETCGRPIEVDVSVRAWITVDIVQKALQVLVMWAVAVYDGRVAYEAATATPLAAPGSGDVGADESLRNTVPSARALRRYRVIAFWIDMFGVLWVVRGSTLFFGQATCGGAPHLFPLGQALISLSIVLMAFPLIVCTLLALAVCFCLPCLVRAILAANGANRKRGATPETLAALETCTYQPGMFAAPGSGSGPTPSPSPDASVSAVPSGAASGAASGADAPAPADPADAPQCAICLSSYVSGDELRVLPCGGAVKHHFHKECCDDWLQLNASCPVCRHPIGGAPAESAASGAGPGPGPRTRDGASSSLDVV